MNNFANKQHHFYIDYHILTTDLVVCDGEHGRGEDDGEKPGHEAHQPRLVLGPDEPRPQRHAHRVVPAQLTGHGGQRPGDLASPLHGDGQDGEHRGVGHRQLYEGDQQAHGLAHHPDILTQPHGQSHCTLQIVLY